MKTTTMQFRPVDQSQWTCAAGWMDLTEEAAQQWGSVPSEVRIKPADPEPHPEPKKAREWWAVVSDVSGCFAQHGVFAGHDLRAPYEIRVREVLSGDDDLRAEVERLRAERDRAWEQYNTFKRLWRERGEENARLRETLNNIAQMAKDGAA